ncbi:MAG: beta-1,6-N-acetylglucosaminyltransferase [Paracoccaceae bacterium]
MSIGIIMLAHSHLHRAEAFARALVRDGCKVAIHVDGKTPEDEFSRFREALSHNRNIVFSPRVTCEWGAFSLTEASLSASEILLRRWPDVSHVAQVSGACLPLRPIPELQVFLRRNPEKDFIESYSASDSRWVKAGLSEERFRFYFPFCWRERRRLFDLSVRLQRRLGVHREIPDGLEPHMGSQWWCLSRRTLNAIVSDPERPKYDRFFRKCWIPDESYFQTLVRKHSRDIECHSLTFARFDHQGKPHIFYDDHESFLAESDRFFARKIWHGADRLYDRLLAPLRPVRDAPEFNPPSLETQFREAARRRNEGRRGLRMQSRFPCHWHERQPETARTYAVFTGFDRAFADFRAWLARKSETSVHGRLFRPDAAEFGANEEFAAGNLSSHPALRDYRPDAFLANFIWNNRATHQSFLFEPGDGRSVGAFLARDPNAQVFVITGAWLTELALRADCEDAELRARAARYQAHERDYLEHLRWNIRGRTCHIWKLGEALREPYPLLSAVQVALDGRQKKVLIGMPKIRTVSRLEATARRIRNLGIDLSDAGELGFSVMEQPAKEASVAYAGG